MDRKIIHSFKRFAYQRPFLFRAYLKLKAIRSAPLLGQPVDIVICGMTRSGSTLVMNVVQELMGRPNEYCYFNSESTYRDTFFDRAEIKKTHGYLYSLEKRILSGRTRAIFTYRNGFDVIASTLQRGWKKSVKEMVLTGYIDAMMMTSLLYVKLAPVIKIRYEDLYSESTNTVQKLYEQLHHKEIPTSTLARCIELFSVDSQLVVKKEQEILKNPDKTTGYHTKHVLDPAPNKYRKILSPDDLDLLMEQPLVREYMNTFGYQP